MKVCKLLTTHPAAIPHCCEAAAAAWSNNVSPTRATVGAIVSGVTNRSKDPIIPK